MEERIDICWFSPPFLTSKMEERIDICIFSPPMYNEAERILFTSEEK